MTWAGTDSGIPEQVRLCRRTGQAAEHRHHDIGAFEATYWDTLDEARPDTLRSEATLNRSRRARPTGLAVPIRPLRAR
jgi:hypothetical protein